MISLFAWKIKTSYPHLFLKISYKVCIIQKTIPKLQNIDANKKHPWDHPDIFQVHLD
jgi:hypothetical protein